MSATTANPESQSSLNLVNFCQMYGPTLALVPALSAMLGSLYYSEIAGFIPCTLCWYQRILMYPLVVIIMVGIIKQDEYLPAYVLPFAIPGLLLSLYHYLVQWEIFGNPAGCGLLSCSARYVNYFGFVTIPFMALVAFTLITALIGAVRWANQQTDDASA